MLEESLNIDVRIIKSAPINDLIALYKSADWWDDSYDQSHDFLKNIAKNSAFFVGVFLDSRMIGMGRALSDKVSDAYIQDIAVLNAFRGQGIGKAIVKTLIKSLKENGVDWIGVVAKPGTSFFYTKLGFEHLYDHIPMKYLD